MATIASFDATVFSAPKPKPKPRIDEQYCKTHHDPNQNELWNPIKSHPNYLQIFDNILILSPP
jgi:hypothetical protein